MDGNWRDCRNCRNSYQRLTLRSDHTQATEAQAHGIRRTLDASLPLQERLDSAYAAIHRDAVPPIGDAVQVEVRRFFKNESASIRSSLKAQQEQAVSAAGEACRVAMNARVDGVLERYFESTQFTRLVQQCTQRAVSDWISGNLAHRIQLNVSANILNPEPPPRSSFSASARTPAQQAQPVPPSPSRPPQGGWLEID